MNLHLDEDTILLRDSVRELGKQKAQDAPQWERARALPSAWLDELSEMGLLAMTVPEAQGGAGMSTLAALAVLEELGAFSASTAVTVAVHNFAGLGLGAEPSGVLGLAQGLTVAGQGDAHAVSGSDPAAFGASEATRFVVLAEHEGELLGLQVEREGVSAQRSSTLGLRAADIGSVTFEQAAAKRLSSDARRARTDLRLAMGFIAAGIGRAALAEGTGYALEREQFGKPIAKFQAIQWKLADLATGLDAAELMLGTAAARTDSGRDAAAARATLAAVQAATSGCSHMLQVHGGYGYTEEYAIERLYRDARAVALYAGVRSEARSVVSEAIIARHAG